MKALYLNPMISSLSNVLEMVVNVKPEKGEMGKLDTLQTEKDYTVVLNIEGKLNGFFAFAFNEDVALKVVNAMTSGMGSTEQIDDLGVSCILELGGMVKGGMINALNEVEYNSEIGDVGFYKKGELPLYPFDPTLKYTVDSKIGEIELIISVY